ncbi:hypothetical protein [Desulfofalx alkaliphila]|uniref:hypothetical protein n=1 Tax=Desulfofalx alkaliphila TaxID=105483 RepID=UPI00146F9BC5|nr:hypothetical protein [Desulfofalx alkaliphila]
MLLPNFLPESLAITQALKSTGYVGITLVLFIVLSLIRIDGKFVFNFAQLAGRGISWNMILMIVVIIPIGVCLTSEAAGITAFISQTMLPIFDGMSLGLFLAAIVVLTVVLTNVLANMPVAMILMPVGISVAQTYGMHAEQVSYLIIAACAIAFLTPAASPAGLLLFSNKEWMRPADIYKYGVPTIITLSVLVLAVNYYWLGLFY